MSCLSWSVWHSHTLSLDLYILISFANCQASWKVYTSADVLIWSGHAVVSNIFLQTQCMKCNIVSGQFDELQCTQMPFRKTFERCDIIDTMSTFYNSCMVRWESVFIHQQLKDWFSVGSKNEKKYLLRRCAACYSWHPCSDMTYVGWLCSTDDNKHIHGTQHGLLLGFGHGAACRSMVLPCTSNSTKIIEYRPSTCDTYKYQQQTCRGEFVYMESTFRRNPTWNQTKRLRFGDERSCFVSISLILTDQVSEMSGDDATSSHVMTKQSHTCVLNTLLIMVDQSWGVDTKKRGREALVQYLTHPSKPAKFVTADLERTTVTGGYCRDG